MKNDARGIVAAALQVNIGQVDRVRKLLNDDDYKYPWVNVSVLLQCFFYVLTTGALGSTRDKAAVP